ncbi:MAG: tripartite tricarboxylate transporter TctB family protein [Bosea sp.]|jgi:hypothetical protein|nr:tripartite tricarboxylate transporter TctB family protein [Bosea sp. (in: a-proteobacteria)]
MAEVSDGPPPAAARGLRSRDFIAGLALLLVGGGALLGSMELPIKTSSGVGSGLLPVSLSLIMMALGVAQIALSWRTGSPVFSGWPWRGTITLLGAIVVFAITIRGVSLGPLQLPALGLVIAGPLTVFIAGMATSDTRLGQLGLLSAGLSAFCLLLFRYGLGQPIPVAPWLIGY